MGRFARIVGIFFFFIVVQQVCSQCYIGCDQKVGAFSPDTPSKIAYDNFGSSFHSSFVREINGFSVWGENMSNTGAHLYFKTPINSTYYSGLTGTVYFVGVGSQSINTAQLIVLTSTGLHASGVTGGVLSTAVKSTTAFSSISVNGKADGLPAGLTPDSIKMMFVTYRTIILTTCSGHVYVLSQDVRVRGDQSLGNANAWSQVMETSTQPLTNVLAARGGQKFGFALKADSTIWTWGDSVMLGNGTRGINTDSAMQMTKPAGIPNIKMIQGNRNGIAANSIVSYYLLGTDKKIYSLGANNSGQLGDRTTTYRSVWVNARYPDSTIIDNAKWISANEHDPNYNGLGVLNDNYNVYTAGINNGSMLGRALVTINHLDTPNGIFKTDKILFVEVGGHTTAYINDVYSTYGYIGHRVNGSLGDSTTASGTIMSVTYNTAPVSLCGTTCDSPKLSHIPYICYSDTVTFIIASKYTTKIFYRINNNPLDSVTIGVTDTAYIKVLYPTTDTIRLTTSRVKTDLCDKTIIVADTVFRKYYKDSFLTICKNQYAVFKGNNINTTGIYRDTIQNSLLCDSFYTLHLTVNDTIGTHIYPTICQGTPYLFNGLNRDITGLYLDTLPRVGTGCDSFLYLHLIVNDTGHIEIKDTFCFGHTITFNNSNISTSGLYLDTLSTVHNCDSFIYYDVFFRTKVDTTHLKDSACADTGLSFNNQILRTSGIYYDTLIDIKGCDSVIELTFKSLTDTMDIVDSICKRGGFKLFYGTTLTAPGIYTKIFSNRYQCDSIIRLSLAYYPDDTTRFVDSICRRGDSSVYHYHHLVLTSPGVYYVHKMRTNGCDSVLELTLHHYAHDDTTHLYDSICRRGFTVFNNQDIKDTGAYYDTLQNRHGCDSVLVLHVKWDTTTTTTYLTRYLCPNTSYYFNGQALTSGGIYWDTLDKQSTLHRNCDSFIRLDLIEKDTSYTILPKNICKESTYSFNGQLLSMPGAYFDTLVNQWGCDSFIELRLSHFKRDTSIQYDTLCYGNSKLFNGKWIDSSGFYQDTFPDLNGCDSFIHLYLYVYPPAEVEKLYYEDCQSVTFRNITYTQSDSVIDVYKFQTTKGCDSFIRKHYIQIWPAPITKPQVKINYCDTIVILGKKHSDTFFHIDTIRKNHSLACDSIYQPIVYQKQITPKGQIQIDPKRDRYFIGDRVTLTPPRARHHLWNSLDTGRFAKYIIYRDTSNYVISWNAIECQDTTYIRLYTTDTAYYRVPRAFTPNGDGINDILYARGDGMEKLVKFEIYNRLGQLLFRTTNIKEGWDGNYKNVAQVSDPYFFIIEAIDYKGKKFVDEGNFLLLR